MSSILLVTLLKRRFFSGHNSAEESTKHSLINSPLENGLLFLAILWDITKLVLAAAPLDMQRLVKQPCCFCSLASKASKKSNNKNRLDNKSSAVVFHYYYYYLFFIQLFTFDYELPTDLMRAG